MREFYSYVWRSSAPRQIVLRILAISAALLAMARAGTAASYHKYPRRP